MENNAREGIVITSNGTFVDGMTVRNNGRDLEQDEIRRAGIRVTNGRIVVITNSTLADYQENPTQTFGIYISANATETRVEGNVIVGNAVEPIRDSGVRSKISDNDLEMNSRDDASTSR